MQATSDKTASANFTQTGHSINLRYSAGNVANGKTGYQPYYQWGRKDAFMSNEYEEDPAEGTSLIYSATAVTIGEAIQNPTTFYNKGGGSGTDTYGEYTVNVYYNAWNASYTSYSASTDPEEGLESVVKTVYDPCPVGYTVPAANTFIGFTMDNMPETVDTGRSNSNGSLFFPYVGERRPNNGKLAFLGTHTFYCESINGTATGIRMFYCSNRQVTTGSYSSAKSHCRSAGNAVRPVREK